MRRRLPLLLAVLSLPAALVGWTAASRILQTVAPDLATGIVGLFVPLLVAGLCMMPFIAPLIDARAKADLAAIQARKEAEGASAVPPADAGDPEA